MTERKHPQQYRVTRPVSTLKDPKGTGWINFDEGETYRADQFPAHVDMADLLKIGAIEAVAGDSGNEERD